MRNFIFCSKNSNLFSFIWKTPFSFFLFKVQSNFGWPSLNHHNFLLEIIKFYLEQWQLFGFLAEISNLWKLFETNWVELNVKCHQTKHEYQKLIGVQTNHGVEYFGGPAAPTLWLSYNHSMYFHGCHWP